MKIVKTEERVDIPDQVNNGIRLILCADATQNPSNTCPIVIQTFDWHNMHIESSALICRPDFSGYRCLTFL